MIEVNGSVDKNIFSHFDELIKGKREVIFARVDVKPLQVYENWKSAEEGYGPSGSPKSIGEKHAISIPMDFTTLRHFGQSGDYEQVQIRYYKSKTTNNPTGQNPITIYDAGDGNPNYLFTGASIRLNVQTAEGKELFRVLMAHPMNADYPSHGPKKLPVFRLLNAEKASEQSNLKEKTKNKAISLAYDPTQVPNSLAVKLHKRVLQENPGLGWFPTDELVESKEMETLRSNLASYAGLKPEDFTELVNSANVGLRNDLKEAYEGLVIDHNEKKWLWGDKVKKNVREICAIPVGAEPFDALVEFLIYDKGGKKVKETIDEAMESVKAAQALLKG